MTSRMAAAVVALTVLVVPVACGKHVPKPGARTEPAVGASPRQAARVEAGKLLSAMSVPSHARRTKGSPSWGRGPLSGSSASHVDRSTVWTVRRSFAWTTGWLARRSPTGLRPDSSTQGSEHGRTTFAGRGFADRPTAAYSSAELQIAVYDLGPRTSGIRVDGLVVWLDQTPLRAPVGGPRIHLSAAGSCPRKDDRFHGVINRGAELNHALLPTGSPTRGLICAYDGFNGHPFSLARRIRLDTVQAGHIARTAAGLSLAHAVGGSTSCPADDDSATLIALAYHDRSSVDLRVHGGCPFVSNGDIVTWAGPLARLLADQKPVTSHR